MILPLNKLIDDRYIVTRLVGSGGMAEIYEANDTYCRKTVALKVIKEQFSDSIFELERFKNEARYASMFSHPHIIKIFNIGYYRKNLFISFELIKGRTLKDVLDERGYLSKEEAINIALQLMEATKYIHERKVLHNDIKPDNIFMSLDGNIKLIDFGIATHIGEEGDKINASILYTAPEVLRTGYYSIQSDLYAVGVLIYELLTGENPFNKDMKTEDIINLRFTTDVPSVNRAIHQDEDMDDIDYVIKKATNRLINLRYKNDDELIKDLLKVKNHERITKKRFLEKLFKK